MDTVLDYQPTDPMAGFEDQAFQRYLAEEREFMAAEGYAQSKEAILRKLAVKVIYENSPCDDFDAFVPYLALIYFDRFISKNPLPNVLDHVRDEVILVANCCLMIAWKMRHRNFRVLEFLAKTDMIVHQRFILPVELAILQGLGWKTRAVTAICFVNMLVHRIPVARHINQRMLNQIIIQNQGSIVFTKFRPSVIAAAAILSACKLEKHGDEMYFICYNFLLAFDFVQEEELDACTEITTKMYSENIISNEKENQRPCAGELSQAGGSIQTGWSSQTGGSFGPGGSSQIGGSSQEEESSYSRSEKETLQEASETKDTEVDPESLQTRDVEPLQETSGTKDVEVDPGSWQNGDKDDKEQLQETSKTKDTEVDPDSQQRHDKEPFQESSEIKDAEIVPETRQMPSEIKDNTEVDPETQQRPGKTPLQDTSQIRDDEIDPGTQWKQDTEPLRGIGIRHRSGRMQLPKIDEIEEETELPHRPGEDSGPELQVEAETEFQRRPGKDIVTEIEEVLPLRSIDDSDPMYFQLKWIMFDPDASEITIDSPLFRTKAETTSAENVKPGRARPVEISCSCLCPLPPDCSWCCCL